MIESVPGADNLGCAYVARGSCLKGRAVLARRRESLIPAAAGPMRQGVAVRAAGVRRPPEGAAGKRSEGKRATQ